MPAQDIERLKSTVSTGDDQISEESLLSKFSRLEEEGKFSKLSPAMQAVYRQHKAMMGLEQSKWFNVPVNPKKFNIPTYPIYIKRPMDLGTIKKKLVNQQPQLPFTLHTHTHTTHTTRHFRHFRLPARG